MELIILLLGGMLSGVFVVAASIASAVVGLIVDLIAMVVGTAVSSRIKAGDGDDNAPGKTSNNVPGKSKPIVSKKFLRAAAWICGGFLVLVFATITVLQLFFFKPAASALISKLGEKNGATIAFADIRGNLFTGKMAVDQLKIESALSGESSWKAEIGTAEFDINMLLVLGKRTWLDSLEIEDATIELNAGNPPAFDPVAGLKLLKPAPKKRYREKRRFGIENTRLKNLKLTWIRPDSTQTLLVNQFDCEHLTSEYAVFQVFFRSSAHGEVNGIPWKIQCDKTGAMGRRTEWQFEAIPLEMVAEMVGGPFQVFKSGTLDVTVIDEWSLDEGEEVDLDWQFVLHDFTAEVPPNLSQSKITHAMVAFANQVEEPLDIHFTLTWNKEELKGSASLDTRGLAMAITRALLPENAAEEVKKKASDLWNKLRKDKDTNETEE